MNKKIIAFPLSGTSLIIGVLIYTFFRKPPLILDQIYSILGVQNSVHNIRNYFSNTILPDWMIFGLPDMLWMFSFTLLIILIWNFKLNRNSLIWIGGAITLGFAFEILQLTNIAPGVFDYKDLVFLLAGALLAFVFTIKNKSYATVD